MYRGKFDAKYREQYLAEKGRGDVVRKDISQTEEYRPKKKSSRRKGSKTATVIFYTLYFLFIIGFCAGTVYLLSWLNDWLVDYEASEPTHKNAEIFEQLFSDPDWGYLYEQAGVEDTVYENKDTYIAYMEAKVGDQELTFMETSAGLSGGRKYYVKLGEERIAAYTLVDERVSEAELPDWQLSTIEVFFQRSESALIETPEGHTVYINGIALDESHTIKITSTKADDYLPLGTTGPRKHLHQIEGLLVSPMITVQDENGGEVPVSYDPEDGIYKVQTEAQQISDDLKSRAITTGKTYGLYMIEHSNDRELAKYFDSTSQTYKTLRTVDPFMQHNFYNGHEFANEEVHDYYRYTEDLFSVRVSMSMNVTRTDGTVKDYKIDQTFFFENQRGVWMVIEMVNVDVSEEKGQVRLTFMDGTTQVSSEFYDMNAGELTVPVLNAPEGKVFDGWYRLDTDEDGKQTYTRVFEPDATGKVSIPADTTLEPMTLYALYETPAAETTPETTGTEAPTETEGA